MSEIGQSATTKSHDDGTLLEVLFLESEGGLPPDEYTCALGAALCNDDETLLMKVLDTQDINPWDICFVEDGLGLDSDDKKDMIYLHSCICKTGSSGAWNADGRMHSINKNNNKKGDGYGSS